jgi:hypothetical protein
MDTYELRLYRNDGTLICAIPTECADETEARKLFDKMKSKGFARVQLNRGDTCVFDSTQTKN